MIAKTEEDFNGLKEIGKIVASIRDELVQRTIPGITTKELDDLAGELLRKLAQFLLQKVNIISRDLLVLVLMKKWHMVFREIGLFKKGTSSILMCLAPRTVILQIRESRLS